MKRMNRNASPYATAPDIASYAGKTAAEQAYAVIHGTMHVYREHWSSLHEKTEAAGASMSDIQDTSDYDFIEAIRAVTWSYLLYAVTRYFPPRLAPCISKDIVSTLVKEGRVSRRRMRAVLWDKASAKKGEPLEQYLGASGCGPALAGFMLSHFTEGRKLLDANLAPLARCADGVSKEEYSRIIRMELWRKMKAICFYLLFFLVTLGMGTIWLHLLPVYIVMAVASATLLVLYIIKRDKRLLVWTYALAGSAGIGLVRLLPDGMQTPILVVVLIALAVYAVIERKRRKR